MITDMKEYKRQWRIKNPDKIREYQERHRERNKARSKKWREENYDRFRELVRNWQIKNNEKTRIYTSNRKRGTRGIKINKSEIHNWETKLCGICNKKIKGDYHLDHIIPLSRGGLHDVSNLQLAHPLCNRMKFTKLPEEFSVV